MSSGIITNGARVDVYAMHSPGLGGRGTVTRAYVQTSGDAWQHVFTVRLDSGSTVEAPSRFVTLVPQGRAHVLDCSECSLGHYIRIDASDTYRCNAGCGNVVHCSDIDLEAGESLTYTPSGLAFTTDADL